MTSRLLAFAPPLTEAVFVGRRKRFFADVLVDGVAVTAHCANTGSMRGLLFPGGPCRLAWSSDPRRKLAATLTQVGTPDGWALVDTALPNRVVAAAIAAGAIPSLSGYEEVRREVVMAPGTRADLCLSAAGRPPCWVEVKNVTWAAEGVARFPDAVTTRGTRHLHELAGRVAAGDRAVLVLHVAHTGAARFAPADDVDPVWGRALRDAVAAGVEVIAFAVAMDAGGVWARGALPVDLGAS